MAHPRTTAARTTTSHASSVTILLVASLLLSSQGTAAAQDPLPYRSLKSYVADLQDSILQNAGLGSNAFRAPPAAQVIAFRLAIRQLLTGNVPSAISRLNALNYDVNTLNDESGKSYLIARERSSGFRGQGTYIVDLKYVRNVVVEAPHPIFDANTPEEGSEIFQALGARGLFIAGTHRCANKSIPSGCSGTTTACGGGSVSVRISDAPHFTQNFMFAAHRATLQLSPQPISLNLHGNSSEPIDVTLSDGTRITGSETALVQRLRKALLAQSITAGSCNWPPDGLTADNLCGTDNTQGRLSNGSPEACTTDAANSSGRFVHIEQHRNIRDNPAALIRALQEVLPSR
jgi:hypothetical protein